MKIHHAPLICLFLLCSTLGKAQTSLTQLNTELQKQYSTKDTVFQKPFIDIDEFREKPVKHLLHVFKIWIE